MRMHHRRVIGSFAAVGLAASLLTSTPANGWRATRDQAACPSPAAPLAHASIYPRGEELPVIVGTEISRHWDTPPNPEPTPTVVLKRTGFQVSVVGTAGDLDRDGANEFVASVASSADATVPVENYLIPGGATGTHDPADIGIRVAPGYPLVIDSRDGDSTPELAMTDLYEHDGGGTVIYSGAALASLTAPADGRTTGVLLDEAGALVGAYREGPGADRFVLASTVLDAEGHIDHTLVRAGDERGFIDLTTAPYGWLRIYGGGTALSPTVVVNSTGIFLQVIQGDRAGVVGYVWRLDDPCGALPPQPIETTTSTTAPSTAPPPATPVSGTASFTG